jgi:hypothetical protein
LPRIVRLVTCFLLILSALLFGCGADGDDTYVSQPDPENEDPRFEMTGAQLTVSGLSSDVWGDTVLVVCMSRAGAYTNEDHSYPVEDVGNVASAEAEWPSGEQALTITFGVPLEAPPAICTIEGSDGDIGSAVFCDTDDETEIPGRADSDGKEPFLIDEVCEGEAI